MKILKDIFFPTNYKEQLPSLKKECFAWKMLFSSKTEKHSNGYITRYKMPAAKSRGDFVFVPGLASNTEIEPLMCAFTYWALSHGYGIYAVDTFLGDFQPSISSTVATKNTLPEFLNLIDTGFEIVSGMAVNKWTCVVGHSLGSLGALEVFNRRVLQNKPIGFSGAILFAPYVVKSCIDSTKDFLKNRHFPESSDVEFHASPVGLSSPHDFFKTGKIGYVSVYPNIYDEIYKLKPRPDLMARYNLSITLVAGGRDRKAPIEYLRDVYNMVHKCGGAIEFVEFPDSKHSFMNVHDDRNAILRLIKTQYANLQKNK